MQEQLEISERIENIINRYRYPEGSLIPILQDIQAEWDYLPKEHLRILSELLRIPLSRIYSVATFYTSLSLTPRGRHLITLCMGTVCYLKGSDKVHQVIQENLGVEAGGTTRDHLFTYQPVNCLGACALAPVMVIDGKYYERITPEKASSIIASYKEKQAV
jgi:NADH-quinone oxidoreductase subunit E